ncbi:hypothetical protein, partial [Sphaerisporangium aureirubrum]
MKSTVRHSGDASGGAGSYVMTGHHEGDVVLAGSPVARSVYLEQVEQIFPWKLVGREAELAELAEFCTGDHDRGYVWWQGPAWAGKSALMASFVLDPPPGVRVVSFFITARYAGQSDRGAFLEVVTEQLAALLGQPLPPLAGEAGRQGWFGRLLKEAAHWCRDRGERLVLVVDGLDEDRGVCVGPGAHSIAALLPEVPPQGMRVVVSGRPDPPVPSDVPVRHPLRDPGIVRMLAPSPAAQVIRDAAERELDHLLYGERGERDLLGLLVAAGGGLSSSDLADLTGVAPGEVDRLLRAVSGRSFASRDSVWSSGRGGRVFVLAHEELVAGARAGLGESVLAGYRERIHDWARAYGGRGWPAGTPEYLLRGYHQMLRSCGEVGWMVVLATDRVRLDRMLDVSGGDAAGLAEVAACQQAVCGQNTPDLDALVRLARVREFLADRNTHIPQGLPAVWAMLGNVLRAEALAYSITDPSGQAWALSDLATALTKMRQTEHAEQVARTITNPSDQTQALRGLATALAEMGQTEHAEKVAHHAEQVARTITNPSDQTWALRDLATALAKMGQTEHAEQVARTITNPSDQAWALRDLATALTKMGQTEHAEKVARTITDPSYQARALHDLATALAEMGQTEHAEEVAHHAEQVARTITNSSDQTQALRGLATALAEMGQTEHAKKVAHHAEQVARTITNPTYQTQALRGLATALAEMGQTEHAKKVAHHAEQVARTITDPSDQAWALRDLATALTKMGQTEHAEQVARTITNPSGQAWALSDLATALTERGQSEHAEQVVGTITDPSDQTRALHDLATALAKMGQTEHAEKVAHHAEKVARTITNPTYQTRALHDLATALAEMGQTEHAEEVAHHAEQVARTITNPSDQAWALSDLATALTERGQTEHAEEVAHHAEQVARTITDPSYQTRALRDLATALAEMGQTEHAEKVARTITNPTYQTRALHDLATAL